MSSKEFTFEISLSVLNHLGRNLYRNFVTVLGEAISNSWDADAENVHIYIDRKKDSFFVKDDGIGMAPNDFQEKFLRIGYSKRRGGRVFSQRGRPYIGRKGIGKLALLSCAEKITVATKIQNGRYTGGSINNSGLDRAIEDDLKPREYSLEELQLDKFAGHREGHEQGTIIYFEDIRGGIRNRLDYLKQVTALYFRFPLHDDSFNIFINNDKVTLDHLKSLSQKTSFLWNINDLEDPFITEKYLTNLKEPVQEVSMEGNVKGFVASVEKPSNLKIRGFDERVSVDLFVNGRLRERDILKHIPTSRLFENYLYGQIHFDELDKGKDRFTSSREGIVADDPEYKDFLEAFDRKIRKIMGEWDIFRLKNKQDGDPENERISKEKRKSLELFNLVSKKYTPPEDPENKQKFDSWMNELKEESSFNLQSYAECFISENLIRKYISEKNLPLSEKAERDAKRYKEGEKKKKHEQNMHIDIRKDTDNLGYLGMDRLAEEVGDSGVQIKFVKDAKEYAPIRNALAHTAFLTDEAKRKLTSLYNNIRAGILKLLS